MNGDENERGKTDIVDGTPHRIRHALFEPGTQDQSDHAVEAENPQVYRKRTGRLAEWQEQIRKRKWDICIEQQRDHMPGHQDDSEGSKRVMQFMDVLNHTLSRHPCQTDGQTKEHRERQREIRGNRHISCEIPVKRARTRCDLSDNHQCRYQIPFSTA